jgi:chloramphenicol 3-O phosphotransferase
MPGKAGPRTGRIILLNGASSSGKSSIARAVQAKIEDPFWHISIDHLRDAGVLPMDRFRSGEFKWSQARDAFFEGFERSLLAYVLVWTASHPNGPMTLRRQAR